MHVILKCNSEPPKALGGRPDSYSKLPIDIGGNLRRTRQQQGFSLEAPSHRSGVSRAMLGQIETGKSVPAVTLIWKIADALGLPAAKFLESSKPCRALVLPRASGRILSRSDGRFTLRDFASPEFDFRAEFFELTIAAGHRECVDAFAHGTRANFLVSSGSLDLSLYDGHDYNLNQGDVILFEADATQLYSNPGASDAVAYLVVAPARNGNAAR